MRERSTLLAKRVESMSSEHEDSTESISSMSSKYGELPTRLSNLQTRSEQVLEQSQNLFSNVNNAQDTVDSLENVNLGKLNFFDFCKSFFFNSKKFVKRSK